MRWPGWVAVLVVGFTAISAGCGGGDNPSVTILPSESTTPGDPGSSQTPGTGETPGPTADGSTTGPAPTATATIAPGSFLPCGDILVPVGKLYALAPDCVPKDLVSLPSHYTYGGDQQLASEAADALMKMLDAARADGIEVFATSSYRSYADQEYTFNYWVSTVGFEQAARQSAQAGHSEHQLGTTTDVVSASAGYNLDNFPGTPEAEWIAQNSWRYGFVVSYPPGTEAITGYIHEPWHIRYVGEEVARQVHESGLTLGEFLLQR